MKKNGKYAASKHPSPITVYIAAGCSREKNGKEKKCPENLCYPSCESPGWKTDQRLHFLRAAEASSRTKRSVKKEEQKTQEGKI
ncbi:hypothetical protein F1880_000306 [Penicillium rolfsii]|nr:hypothetical protein F1880_000306 [Penicillium rolfsii]